MYISATKSYYLSFGRTNEEDASSNQQYRFENFASSPMEALCGGLFLDEISAKGYMGGADGYRCAQYLTIFLCDFERALYFYQRCSRCGAL